MNSQYQLDNAAKLFPSVTTIRNSSVFRISAVMKDKIDALLLQKAVDCVYDRFPMLFFRLKNGLFWNYFDKNYEKFLVAKETEYPCGNISASSNQGYFLKILYSGCRISIEIFHSLTDAGGAIEFLKSILFYYLTFQGNSIHPENTILLANTKVELAEREDSFHQNYVKYVKAEKISKNEKNAYHIRGTPFECYGNNVITGILSAKELNAVAKTKNATITAYLAALLVFSIYNAQQKYTSNHQPIVVSVPVNLRKEFPSKSLRNFFGVVNIGMSVSSNTSFDEIVAEMTRQLKEKNQHTHLQRVISKSVKLEKSFAVRFVPLFIKNIFIGLGFNLFGEIKKTITLSNIGNIQVPTAMRPFIETFEVVLYPTSKSPINCGVVSINDTLTITFSQTIIERESIQSFFNYLTDVSGLTIRLYSNDWRNPIEPL